MNASGTNLGALIRRALVGATLGLALLLATTGVAAAQGAPDNESTENAFKFLAAAIAMGLGAIGPGSASGCSAARRWRRWGAIRRRRRRSRPT